VAVNAPALSSNSSSGTPLLLGGTVLDLTVDLELLRLDHLGRSYGLLRRVLLQLPVKGITGLCLELNDNVCSSHLFSPCFLVGRHHHSDDGTSLPLGETLTDHRLEHLVQTSEGFFEGRVH
jgi:hypothetical protein